MISVGTFVISLAGEFNDLGTLGEVRTGPCALGVVDAVNAQQEESYSVRFPHCGAVILLTQAEIDSVGYVVTSNPAALRKIIVCYHGAREYDTYLVPALHADDLAGILELGQAVRHATVYELQ